MFIILNLIIIIVYLMHGEPHAPVSRLDGQFNSHRTVLPHCQPPRHHIAYIKVHKTGSSTIACILDSYGLKHNLSFVESFWDIYHLEFPFDILEEKLLPPLKDHHDILTSHARYNKEILSALMPADTVYVSSVRDPLTQFVSSFNFIRAYREFGKMFNVSDRIKTLEIFLTEPEKLRRLYLENVRLGLRNTIHHSMLRPNQQLYFLGE